MTFLTVRAVYAQVPPQVASGAEQVVAFKTAAFDRSATSPRRKSGTWRLSRAGCIQQIQQCIQHPPRKTRGPSGLPARRGSQAFREREVSGQNDCHRDDDGVQHVGYSKTTGFDRSAALRSDGKPPKYKVSCPFRRFQAPFDGADSGRSCTLRRSRGSAHRRPRDSPGAR